MSEAKRPKVNSESQNELDRVQEQFDEFDKQVKDLTLDRMNMAPKLDLEPQTKLSQNEIADSKDIYLKPVRTIGSKEKFNEKFREDYNFAKEYVFFIAEHKEIIGEKIEVWTKAFPGQPAEFWEVPTSVPVWGPRYLAERIQECSYHRLKSEESSVTGSDGRGKYYGQLVVDTVVPRLSATPATKRRSIFMGNTTF